MKKHLIILLFMMGTIDLFSIDPIPTDPPPCYGEGCDPLAWQLYEITYTDFALCDDCSITVFVKVNIPCKEMYIVNYELDNMECTTCFGNQNWTWTDVNREIILKLILSGPLTPYYPTSETMYKISEVACWKAGGSMMNDWAWQPCDVDACCIRTYKIFKEDGQDPVYSFYSSQMVGEPCGHPCASVCDMEYWYPTIWILEKIENQIKFTQNKIYPNPNNGLATLLYSSQINGKVEFTLYNNVGKLVYQKDYLKSQYEDNILLDLNSLNSGTYNYKIIISNNAVSSGKIIISK